jgi:uncharacterized protein (TIGR00369 family)
MSDTSIPEGFHALKRVGPFLDMFGPIYVKSAGKSRIVGLRVVDKHLNTRGIAHGGLLVSLADSALGINLSYYDDPPRPLVTVNLSSDFLQPAQRGDWLEAHVVVQRLGVHLAFASCNLMVGGKHILRASGVFALLAVGTPIPGKDRFDG